MKSDYEKKYREIIARAWSDPAFKSRLMANPKALAAEYGMPVPDGLELTVVENTPTRLYVILPAKPPEGFLSEEQLEAVVGGAVPPPDPNFRPPTSWG